MEDDTGTPEKTSEGLQDDGSLDLEPAQLGEKERMILPMTKRVSS